MVRFRVVAAVSVIIVSAAGCGAQTVDTSTPNLTDDSSPASSAPTHRAVGKYEQTWHHAYGTTTCSQWATKMNAHQRFVASADMLSGARDKGDGGHGVAPDKLVRAFIADVDDACSVVPSRKITEIAAGVYLTERAKYEP